MDGDPPSVSVNQKTEEPTMEEINQQLVEFLDRFIENHREDNFLSVTYGNYTVYEDEVPGEVVDWTLQLLHYM